MIKTRESKRDPRAHCVFVELLQSFLNSNSDRDSHTDHRVVACAQEAHHFHMKDAFGVFLPAAGRDEACLFLNQVTHHLRNDDSMIIRFNSACVKANHHKTEHFEAK